MATNQHSWKYDIFGSGAPLIIPGLCQAGTTKAICQGEIVEKTAATNTKWVPLDADENLAGKLGVMWQEIESGDLEGYYQIIAPRPGDVFCYALASATNPALGDALYWSGSQAMATTGTNVYARVIETDQYPWQNKKSLAQPDKGTILKTISNVHMVFNYVMSVLNGTVVLA